MESEEDLNMYKTEPVTSSPYTAGAVNDAYMQRGLDAANFYRYISGLQGDLTLDETLIEQAQHGAVLFAVTGYITHAPTQPADMATPFYELGFDSAQTSNLFWTTNRNENIFATSVKFYMDDSDDANISKLGHRRWILSPSLQKIGYGLAHKFDPEQNWTAYYSTMQIFDTSRANPAEYNYSLYPNRGAFPLNVFDGNQAWSVQLNPSQFEPPSISSVQVTLTRLADQRKWQFDEKVARESEQGTKKFFNVDTTNYGYGSAIIFRPDNLEINDGDRFSVTITGLRRTDGTAVQLSYETEFFDVQSVDSDPGSTQSNEKQFHDIGSHWAKDAIYWAVQNEVVNGYEDGTFRPNNHVTEAEFLVMLFKLYANAETVLAVDASHANKPASVWSDRFYDYALAYNLDLQASASDVSKRNQTINRTGVASIIAGLGGKHYTDSDDAIRYLLQMGYSSGKTSPTVEGYAGEESLTRAEAIVFLRNLHDKGFTLIGRPNEPTPFVN